VAVPKEVDETPRVSVLIPFFNVEKYIEESIRSAQKQTFQNVEFICVNDGSTDTSREIVARLAAEDERITIIDKPNSGYGATMNVGLHAAKGDYVAILETDDILDSRALEVLINAAKTYDAEVVKANYYLYWSVPEERNEFVELITPAMANRLVNPQVETQIFYQPPSIWTGLYKRSFLLDNEIDFLETPGASYQDTAFCFKVWASATRAVYLTDAFLHYRQDNETSSVNSKEKIFCVCDEYAEMRRYLDKRPNKKAELIALNTKMKFNSYMWNLTRLVDKDRLVFIEHMAKEFLDDARAGYIDYALFEPWKVEEINAIMASPESFFIETYPGFEGSIFQKINHYRQLGGYSLVFKMIKRKLFN
jgi:glycosyltransferase involved in cell wall biosynthesis